MEHGGFETFSMIPKGFHRCKTDAKLWSFLMQIICRTEKFLSKMNMHVI